MLQSVPCSVPHQRDSWKPSVRGNATSNIIYKQTENEKKTLSEFFSETFVKVVFRHGNIVRIRLAQILRPTGYILILRYTCV